MVDSTPRTPTLRTRNAVQRGYCTCGRVCISTREREREGLKSHSIPLFSSLCLPRGRSLKWPPSRRSPIGRDLPSSCALTLSLDLFPWSFSDVLIVNVCTVCFHILERHSFLFCARRNFELHSLTQHSCTSYFTLCGYF